MLGVVATLKVKPGMDKQFEAVAKELVAKVNASEPGCKLYALHHGETPGCSWSGTSTRPRWKRIGRASTSRRSVARWASSWTAGPQCSA